MEKIINDNGILFLEEGINRIRISAEDLYNSDSSIKIKNKEYNISLSDLSIRKSKIALQPIFSFKLVNSEIRVYIEVERKNNKYVVPFKEDFQSDYVIIDHVCYFLSNIELYLDILNKVKCYPWEPISYVKYIEFIKELNADDIDYLDEVEDAVQRIKTDSFDFSVKGLQANLFDYQKTGSKWLSFMYENKCGCILGDEMGLGKTLQVISLIGYIKEKIENMKALVVAPVSLLENWKREIRKFYPSLSVLVHHGSRRTGLYTEFLNYDVVVTSYSNCQSDLSMLNMIEWDLLAIDEAQNIKNPYANRTKIVKSINRKMSVAITGTPFENHLTDIWSLTDFVIPNYLGTLSYFNDTYTDNSFAAVKIEKYLSPIMIRRRVSDVAQDLPNRIDIPQAINMSSEEASYYDEERRNVSLSDLKSTRIDKIQGLRMFCTHPMVYKKGSAVIGSDPILISTKYARTCEILSEIFEHNEKAIIFTSFNEMNRIFVEDLGARFSVSVLSINGDTPPIHRQEIVDKFSNINGSALLILNPKAAGTGLNITAANHVIHYNLEWNPAIEDQASARAYRRGQDKTVFVYRLFYANTIEEVINERIQKKRNLSDLAVIGNLGDTDEEDLIKALELSPCGGI